MSSRELSLDKSSEKQHVEVYAYTYMAYICICVTIIKEQCHEFERLSGGHRVAGKERVSWNDINMYHVRNSQDIKQENNDIETVLVNVD